MITAYKIVEVVNGDIRTLFHGLNGSRIMPRGKWLMARETMVKDGTSKTTYLSGWHVFLSLTDCEEYLDKFTNRRELLRCVKCYVWNVREKTHSPSPIMLAQWIIFTGV